MWDWLKAIDHGDLLLKNAEFYSLFSIDLMDYIDMRNAPPDSEHEKKDSSSTAPSSASASTPDPRAPPTHTDASLMERCNAWFERNHLQMENIRLSPDELSQIAGALIKTGMAGTRIRRNAAYRSEDDSDAPDEPPSCARTSYICVQVYYIDPVAATNIQRFINNSPLLAFMDAVRPGYEGCGDQLRAISAVHDRADAPQITQFNSLMARRHAAWATSAEKHSRTLTESYIESARKRYPI